MEIAPMNTLYRNIQTKPLRFTGFTLSELLVSLSVLALIAAFSIPSILAGLEKNQKKARYNETFNVISNVVQSGVASGELTDSGNITYLGKNVNAQKICTNASAEGCWGSSDTTSNTATSPAIVLHSGAIITDIEADVTGADRYFIDVNGVDEPNIRCEDQFPVVVSIRENSNFESKILRIGEVKRSSIENGYFTGDSCAENQFPS
jgi:prepilin-type N-terminal cleavage/methylation domain-containing protein